LIILSTPFSSSSSPKYLSHAYHHTAGALESSLSLDSMEEQFFLRSRLYYVVIEEMNFTITETLRASRVEKWIRAVKRWFLDTAPIKCVGLDCEFTTHEVPQRAAVLQLSVASEILIFQICKANGVPQLLKDFLKDITIKFCGAAINNDLRMLRSYGIVIPSAYDLQKVVPNPTSKLTPSLYDLANTTIGTHLKNKKRDKKKKDKKKYKKKGEKEEDDDDEEDELIFGWEKFH
jgi:hypothetical protein